MWVSLCEDLGLFCLFPLLDMKCFGVVVKPGCYKHCLALLVCHNLFSIFFIEFLLKRRLQCIMYCACNWLLKCLCVVIENQNFTGCMQMMQLAGRLLGLVRA